MSHTALLFHRVLSLVLSLSTVLILLIYNASPPSRVAVMPLPHTAWIYSPEGPRRLAVCRAVQRTLYLQGWVCPAPRQSGDMWWHGGCCGWEKYRRFNFQLNLC